MQLNPFLWWDQYQARKTLRRCREDAAVFKLLCGCGQSMTAHEISGPLNTWTPKQIRRSLARLCATGRVLPFVTSDERGDSTRYIAVMTEKVSVSDEQR